MGHFNSSPCAFSLATLFVFEPSVCFSSTSHASCRSRAEGPKDVRVVGESTAYRPRRRSLNSHGHFDHPSVPPCFGGVSGSHGVQRLPNSAALRDRNRLLHFLIWLCLLFASVSISPAWRWLTPRGGWLHANKTRPGDPVSALPAKSPPCPHLMAFPTFLLRPHTLGQFATSLSL